MRVNSFAKCKEKNSEHVTYRGSREERDHFRNKIYKRLVIATSYSTNLSKSR